MKRIIFCIVCSGILVISGCGDRPSFFQSKPVIKLKGIEDNYLAAGDKYYDEGAIAYDKDDGDISKRIIVSGLPPDNAKQGFYLVKYKVVNSKGIAANEIKRNVTFISPSFSSGYESKETDIQPHPESRYVPAIGIFGLYIFDRIEDRLVKIIPSTCPLRGIASVSYDGSKIAVKNNKNIDIWDSSSWMVTDSFRVIADDSENGRINSVLFSPHDYTLLICDSDNIKLWDASTGVLLSSIDKEDSADVKFNSDGTKIGAGSENWYVADGTVAQKFEPDSEYPWKKDNNEEQERAGGYPWKKHWDADSNESTYPFREKSEEEVPHPEFENIPSYPWSSKGTYINTEIVDEDGRKNNTWEKVE